jgi:hypothetical protein
MSCTHAAVTVAVDHVSTTVTTHLEVDEIRPATRQEGETRTAIPAATGVLNLLNRRRSMPTGASVR